MKHVNHHNIKAFKALFSVLEATSYVSHDKIMKDIDDHYSQMLEELGEVDSDECVDSFCAIVTQSLNNRGTMRYLYRDDITEAVSAWRASKGSRESLIGNTTTTQEYSTGQEVESQQGKEKALSMLNDTFFWRIDECKAFLNKCKKEHTLTEVADFYYKSNGKKLYRNREGKERLMKILIRLNIIPPNAIYDTFRRVFKD